MPTSQLSVWKTVKSHIPKKIVDRMFTAQKKIRNQYINIQNKRFLNRNKNICLPPASLRYRVHGDASIEGFLKVGKQTSVDIENALKTIGKDLGSFSEVLDFGCGCGRTLRWFSNMDSSTRFYGTDIDSALISWCKENLKFGVFTVNKYLPPMDYSPDTFDLVYAISVFTHLNEEYQFLWLKELKRIVKPKGIVILTVQGSNCWKHLPQECVSTIEKTGFLFGSAPSWKGIFPEWYQNAYHTEAYIFDRYSKYFTVLRYIPKGVNNHQDVFILQKA